MSINKAFSLIDYFIMEMGRGYYYSTNCFILKKLISGIVSSFSEGPIGPLA